LIEEIGFASSYFFKYSPRPGTPGADLPDQVDEVTKSQRLSRLQALVEAQQHAFNQKMIGATLDILFEKPGRRDGQIGGKSPYLQAVHVEAPRDLIGTTCRVEIIGTGTNSLLGRLTASSVDPSTHHASPVQVSSLPHEVTA
jgi:tRNA-2-methylthio-N6-dimethylallyladenosine synthase